MSRESDLKNRALNEINKVKDRLFDAEVVIRRGDTSEGQTELKGAEDCLFNVMTVVDNLLQKEIDDE